MNLSLLEGSPVRVVFNDLVEGTPSNSFKCNANINQALLSIEGASTVALTVEGCINDVDEEGKKLLDDDCTWIDLALVNVSNLSVVTSVEDNGAFYVTLSGFARVRINPTTLTGAPKISLTRVE